MRIGGRQYREEMERAAAVMERDPSLTVNGIMQRAHVCSTVACRVKMAAVEAVRVEAEDRKSKTDLSQRARDLVRSQLANGPKAEAYIIAAAEAAAISERSLIAAADRLGVRCQRGQWWLPG